jgi:cell wall-associated NlpC family hydrolase
MPTVLRRNRSVVLAVVATALVALLPRPAGADPVADKRAEAARLSARIDELGAKESALAEQYNRARLEADTVNAKVAATEAKVAQLSANLDAARAQVRDIAIASYTRGTDPSFSAVLTTQGNPALASAYAGAVTADTADAIDSLRAASEQLKEQRQDLAANQQKARAALAAINARKADVVKTENALNATLANVKGDLAQLVAQADAARQAAAQREAAQRAPVDRASRSRTPESYGAAPAVRAGAQAAVSEALRQVGKPYEWGAAGPNSFDCSGLTMWAWRAGGVSLPHYTGAQYSATTHISMSQLQPGDLVYAGDMSHMAMYIGNGNIVEAPHTGANVRVVPLRAEFTLASRP